MAEGGSIQRYARLERLWAVYRQNLDGSQPRYYFSFNAPEDPPGDGPRGRVRPARPRRATVGLDEYETRTWAGWHHHITLCLLAGAFLLSLQQDWGGKDAPDHAPPGVRVVREMLPVPGRVSCCDGLRTSSGATNDRGALMRSGVPPDAGKAQESLLEAVVVILAGCGKTLLSTQGRKLSDDKRRPIACSERIIRIGLSHAECRRDS